MTQRTTIKVNAGFDPKNPHHVEAVMTKFHQSGDHGDGWKLQSYDEDNQTLTLIRQSAVTNVARERGGRSYKVALDSSIKPSDGELVAKRLESDPAHAGFYLTHFEPHLGKATLSKMTLHEVRVRGAVATALSVKPWDVRVRPRSGGGFDLELPESYVPSKHNDKLQEVAEQVAGTFGWYFEGDPAKLRGEIVPSDPPTFPPSIPYPMELLPKSTPGVLNPIPFGLALAERGDEENTVAYLDLEAAPHAQIGGTSGSGKSVTLNSIIAGALAAGAELAIADVPAKAVDYEMWRPFVRNGGWGCESFEENAVMLQELYNEGLQRAETLKQYGAKRLADLPADMQRAMPPVFIIVDEATGLLAPGLDTKTIPRGLGSDHPLVLEGESKMLASNLIRSYIEKIAAEQRFVGFKLVLSTQVASVNTGISTALRTNLAHKMLLGARATDANRKLILADPASAPAIPEHIQQGPGATPKGVGVAELEGVRPFIFKSFFASETDFIKQLRARGIQPLPPTQLDQTRPDPDIVQATFPQLKKLNELKRNTEVGGFGRSPRPLEDWEIDPETGKPLTGFQRANAARHQLTQK